MNGEIAKGIKLNIFSYSFRLWAGGCELEKGGYGRVWLFPWNGYYRRRLKQKFMWWLAIKLPKQAALYAMVRVHALSGEGPEYEGEYSQAYKLWVKTYRIEE